MRYACADLFCGGGGTSTGMIEAFRKAGADYSLIGVNHWKVAIETNRMNHGGDYYCASIDGLDPTDVVKDGRLDFLWASPECTNHSRAKGGMPRQNQSRCQPEILLSWIRKLLVKRLYVENVPDFLDWGPLLAVDTVINGKLHKAGTPDPRRKTVFFRDWIDSIRKSGYRVDWRILNAADYGAPTSRERLIVQAVRIGTGERIAWPEPTHAEKPDLFIKDRWVPARDIIDWSIQGKSIFDRAKPLKPNTLRRIENGIRKYWGTWAVPFLILLRGTRRSQLNCTVHRLDEPVPTISAGGGHLGLVRPFLTHYHGGEGAERRTSGMDEPLPTCDCSNRYGLVCGVVEPLFVPQQSCGTVKPVSNPLPTIAASGAISVVEGLITSYYGNSRGCSPVGRTLGTVMTKDRFGLVEGKLFKTPDGQTCELDISFRMLQPHELAAAMSFPPDYKFCGTKTEQIRQIGNAVCPRLSEALISAAISS
jgi:DNA (cytosine-5)-methyltransferase 1